MTKQVIFVCLLFFVKQKTRGLMVIGFALQDLC